jgi:cytochrome c oxidase subunit 2
MARSRGDADGTRRAAAAEGIKDVQAKPGGVRDGFNRLIDRALAALALMAGLLPLPASAAGGAWPMGYLTGFGTRAYPIRNLVWGVLLISLAVTAITIVLLLGGLIRGRWRRAPTAEGGKLVGSSAGGLTWIIAGVGLTTLTLIGVSMWTVVTLASVSKMHGDLPNAKAAFELEVTGHQWWWEVKYKGKIPARGFTTANEIHIPAGQPVRVKLRGVDVIHSFWIPALGGKTDIIPGQINETWLEATRPGTYRGQCTEYCGQQHANMALYVIADTPEDFAAWWDHQLEAAPVVDTESEVQAQNQFIQNCGVCHTVRGTRAGGVLGPNLSHLMTRTTLAAGILPNNLGYLSAWISDPQSIKPGTLMPRLNLSAAELNHIRNFLGRLN